MSRRFKLAMQSIKKMEEDADQFKKPVNPSSSSGSQPESSSSGSQPQSSSQPSEEEELTQIPETQFEMEGMKIIQKSF